MYICIDYKYAFENAIGGTILIIDFVNSSNEYPKF